MKKPKHIASIQRFNRGEFYVCRKNIGVRDWMGRNYPSSAGEDYYLLLRLSHFYKTGLRFEVLASATKEDFFNASRRYVGYKTIKYGSEYLKYLQHVEPKRLSLYLGGHTSEGMERSIRKVAAQCTGPN